MSSSGTPISSLPAAGTPLDGSEVLAGVQGGSTVKIPVSGLVLGPASSTDGHIALLKGSAGNEIEDSGVAPGPYASALLGQLPGTTSNTNATAGKVGEYIESVVAVGSPVALTTTVAANLTSVSLTAGDWDVEGYVESQKAAGTTMTTFIGGLSQVTGTLPSRAAGGAFLLQVSVGAGSDVGFSTGRVRVSLATTTTVFLVAQGNFTGSTMGVYGSLRARRVR